MIPGKKGIELSMNFLVTLIIAVVVFGMGIYLANMIFGGGTSVAEEKFEDFDRQVGELSCYAADNVCIHQKSATMTRGKFKALAVTVKNALKESKQFKLVVQNTRMIDQAGDEQTVFEPLLLYGLETGRIELLGRGEKKTFGVGIEAPKNVMSGQYTLNAMVYYADPGANPDLASSWEQYIERPYKMFITIP